MSLSYSNGLQRHLRIFDGGFQLRPWYVVRQQCQSSKADRSASRKPIRWDNMKSPLQRITMICSSIHDWVMRKHVNIGKPTRIGNPIGALEISLAGTDIENRF